MLDSAVSDVRLVVRTDNGTVEGRDSYHRVLVQTPAASRTILSNLETLALQRAERAKYCGATVTLLDEPIVRDGHTGARLDRY